MTSRTGTILVRVRRDSGTPGRVGWNSGNPRVGGG
jgi:hypothetical protein